MTSPRAEGLMLVISGSALELVVISGGKMIKYQVHETAAAALLADAAKICAKRMVPKEEHQH